MIPPYPTMGIIIILYYIINISTFCFKSIKYYNNYNTYTNNISQNIIRCISKCYKLKSRYFPNKVKGNCEYHNVYIKEHGCNFIRAQTLHDNTKLVSYDDVRRHVSVGNPVELVYSFESPQTNLCREYTVVYNVIAKTTPGLFAPNVPPHNELWDKQNKRRYDIIAATVNSFDNDGKHYTYDVTDNVNKFCGPLNDFHGTAGITITGKILVPDLPDNIIVSTLTYFTDDGEETNLKLPHIPSYVDEGISNKMLAIVEASSPCEKTLINRPSNVIRNDSNVYISADSIKKKYGSCEDSDYFKMNQLRNKQTKRKGLSYICVAQ